MEEFAVVVNGWSYLQTVIKGFMENWVKVTEVAVVQVPFSLFRSLEAKYHRETTL